MLEANGVRLYSDVYRPARRGSFPVLLIRLPYDKRQAQNVTFSHPSWYARNGYVVVVQDTRGRGRSAGDFDPFTYEEDDGSESIEWAAGLAGANGRVGMYGFSYAGISQLWAARRRPPSLRTICPAFCGPQVYDGWTYNAGALSLSFVASWATMLELDGARRARDDEAIRELSRAFVDTAKLCEMLPLREYAPLAVGGRAPYFHDWLSHPLYDDYWRRWSIDQDYEHLDVPALHVGGWYDVFVNGTIENFVGMSRSSCTASSQQRLLMGPWYHTSWARRIGELDFGPEAEGVVDQWQVRWFDQFLKDTDTGILDHPVTVFVTGQNRWENFDGWPPRDARQLELHLRSDGTANSARGTGSLDRAEGVGPADVFTYDPLSPTPSVGGHSCCFPHISPMGPAEQGKVEALNSVLVYSSERLERDLTVVGPARLTLFAASSCVDTDFTAKLCDVWPDGRSFNIQEGIIRARVRNSLEYEELLTPWEIYRFEIDLGNTAHVFQRGHRIRLQVSSSDFPRWDRNLNTGGTFASEGAGAALVATQVVFHEGEYHSRLELSVLET